VGTDDFHAMNRGVVEVRRGRMGHNEGFWLKVRNPAALLADYFGDNRLVSRVLVGVPNASFCELADRSA